MLKRKNRQAVGAENARQPLHHQRKHRQERRQDLRGYKNCRRKTAEKQMDQKAKDEEKQIKHFRGISINEPANSTREVSRFGIIQKGL